MIEWNIFNFQMIMPSFARSQGIHSTRKGCVSNVSVVWMQHFFSLYQLEGVDTPRPSSGRSIHFYLHDFIGQIMAWIIVWTIEYILKQKRASYSLWTNLPFLNNGFLRIRLFLRFLVLITSCVRLFTTWHT